MSEEGHQSSSISEQDNLLSHSIFDSMSMPNRAERRKFLEVSSIGFEYLNFAKTGFDDWLVFVSILLQMAFLDLDNPEEFLDHLKDTGSGLKESYGSCKAFDCSCAVDKFGRIYFITLKPKNGHSTIPDVIGRLDRLRFLHLRGHHVNSLPLHAFSSLPRLIELYMVLNTTNLKTIGNQIRNHKARTNSNIRRIHFLGGSMWSRNSSELGRICWDVRSDLDTKQSLAAFLNFFGRVEWAVFPIDVGRLERSCHVWQYALILNIVGRKFLFGNSNQDDQMDLPLSSWPIILQRAQRRIGKRFKKEEESTKKSAMATGMYYLLREGPALIGRADLQCR